MLQERIQKHFRLPIEFATNVYKTPNNLVEDLELERTIGDISDNTIYNFLLRPKTRFGKNGIMQWISRYTTDIKFLQNHQNLVAKFSNQNSDNDDHSTEHAWMSYQNIKEDDSFIDKYQYLNWDKLKFLNKSTLFLAIMSMYSIVSPALNLLAPLLLLLIPFLLLKFKGLPVTLSAYIRILMVSIKNHSFGKLITQWEILPWGQRIYLLLMVGMYVYNIYQNALSCYQFYKNSYTINQDIKNIKHHLFNSREKLGSFIANISNYESFTPYREYLQNKLEKVDTLYQELNGVPLASFNPKKIPLLGYTMKQYYLLYESEEIEETLLFTFGFHGYMEKLGSIHSLYKTKVLTKSKFSNSVKPKISMKAAYYPTIVSDDVIRNNVSLKANKLITGPNASGKTTLLKTVTTNLLLTQQIGFGFYKKATITPFNHIHCYLNIPDTSSRDSLFQAEARRCLDIIQTIDSNREDKHFCIFDELFSGTNPYEAISSAQAYLQYISEIRNVRFMLTTHFIQLCDQLDSHRNIENINMNTTIVDDIPEYKYKICKGISKIKGGITVLKELGYPDDIIDKTRKIVNNF